MNIIQLNLRGDKNKMLSMRLKQLREAKGLSQAELARRINVGRDSYNKYERTGIQPTYETLINLATEFGVSVDYLLGKSETPNPTPPDTAVLLEKIARLEAEKAAIQAVLDQDIQAEQFLKNFSTLQPEFSQT